MANHQPRAALILDDPDLRETLRLNMTPEDGEKWLSQNATVLRVKRIPDKDIFPPKNVFWAEIEQAKTDWDKAWEDCPLADDRGPKGEKKDPAKARRIVVKDRSVFKHIFKRGQAVVAVDEESGDVVFARLPNILQHKEILNAINGVCRKIALENRDDRRDDPGAIASAGHTIGDRSKAGHPTVQGRGHHLKNMPALQRARVWYENGCLATFSWSAFKYKLPRVVLQDFDGCIENHSLPRMDGGQLGNEYSLWTEDQKKEYRFTFEEAAPPRIACAINYARYTHNETGKNKYAVAFTTRATAKPNTGGNFYVAQYSILSEQEADTVTVWRVKDFHGTSIYPDDPERMTSGVAFVIPSGVKAVDFPGASDFTMEQIRATQRPKVEYPKQRDPSKKSAEHVNRRGVNAIEIDTESEDSDDDDAGASRDLVEEAPGDQEWEDNPPPAVQWWLREMADRANIEMAQHDHDGGGDNGNNSGEQGDEYYDDQRLKNNKRSKFEPAVSSGEGSDDGLSTRDSKRRKVETTDASMTSVTKSNGSNKFM